MPTIRCPSCKRALNLPEHAEFATARCPLCQTDFDVPASAPPPAPSLAPAVFRADTASAGQPSPFHFPEEPGAALPAGDRKALASAANWLKVAGCLGVSHSVLCWCGTVVPLEGMRGAVAGCCLAYVLQFVACALVFRGGREMASFRGIGYARTAVRMAFLAALLEVLFALPLLLFMLERHWGGDRDLILCLAGLRVLLVALLLTAAIKTTLALQRPGVRRALR
jgi:LSD1 subclass zinc finger protein